MIDSWFIINYTNALWSLPPENSPTYEEFQQMFRSHEIYRYEWALNQLGQLRIVSDETTVLVGAGYGVSSLMLQRFYKYIPITLLETNSKYEVFLNHLIKVIPLLKTEINDIYTRTYTEQIVISLSCENIDVKKWIKKLPKHTIVVLQTLNDFDEFKEQTQLSETLFSDTLKIETSVGTITRNMLIGRT